MDSDLLTFAGAAPKGVRTTNDILFDAFLAADVAEEPVPRVLAPTLSLPDVSGFMRPANVFTTPSASVPATPAQPPHLSGAATVPTNALSFEPLCFDSAQGFEPTLHNTYASYLNTPALTSPGGPLFAPLDELRAGEPTDELLERLAADPALRQSLVHALVDYIQPTVAYQPVAPSPSALLAQAQTLASAAAGPEPAWAPEQPMWVNEADAALVESLLSLLSPMPDSAFDMLSPPMPDLGLGLLSPQMPDPASDMLSPRMPESTSALMSAELASPTTVPAAPAAPRKRFHCDVCNRGFSRQYNMRTHRLTHDPKSGTARPHNCRHCRRTFTRKHDLERHQVLHDDADAFKCAVCDRGFARLDVLQRHTNAVHKGAV
ncbi:hypothetical protein IWW56_004820 [Coemansia sp. RSA 2131]|nr:hypothetical protein IWW56_004820 [Coemansia sp. RSA 2131]